MEADWNDRTVFEQGLTAQAQSILESLPGASIYHMDLTIADDISTLSGRQEVRYTNQEDEPLEAIYFRLFPNIAGGKTTVSNVQVNGQDVQPAYEAADSALRVPLAEPLQPGEAVTIAMDFEDEIPREMGGTFGLFGYFDNILVLDTFYPTIPVYDQSGWYAGTPPLNGDITYFDASFYLVRITAPASLNIVASGITLSRQEAGESQVLTIAAGPARDFYLAASELFTVTSTTFKGITINSIAESRFRQSAEVAMQTAVNALRFFRERFGSYPYTELDIVSTPMLALGIEYPGLTGIRWELYDPSADFDGVPSRVILETVVAHEVAHQWFYNVVGNDQTQEAWLDEAMAQYATWLYYLDVYGEETASQYKNSWTTRWDRVEQAEIPIGLPSSDYTPEAYSPIVYGRGPFFIEALAAEMGQPAFAEFLRDYYQSQQWGIATGATFRQMAESHCQCDLTELFEAWVYP